MSPHGGRGAQRFRNGGTLRRKLAGTRAKPVQHEKIQQAQILQLAALVVERDPATGTPAIWETGRPRSRGRGCPACGTFVTGDMGMRATPGHPDLVMFLKARNDIKDPVQAPRLLYWETKAGKNPTSPDQVRFLLLAGRAGALIGIGDYQAFVDFLLEQGYISRGSLPHYRQPAAPVPES